MDAENAVICHACGTRNKSTWEFCARCAEPLDMGSAAPAALEALAADADTVVVEEVEPESEAYPGAASSVFWASVLIAVVVGGVGVLYWSIKGGKTESVTPIFALPIVPPVGARPVAVPKNVASFIDARAQMWHGESEAALATFAGLVADQPENALYRFTYAQALWDVERWEESLTQLRVAARLAPTSYGPMLAHTLAAAHHNDEALREFEQVATTQPSNTSAIREYAELLGTTGDPQKAERVLRRALASQPNDFSLRSSLGQALEQAGDATSAQDVYRTLLVENAQQSEIRDRLARSLWARGQDEDARALYREGLRINPFASNLHRGFAEMQESAGDLKEAAAHYREAARLARGGSRSTASTADALVAHASDLERRAADEGTVS